MLIVYVINRKKYSCLLFLYLFHVVGEKDFLLRLLFLEILYDFSVVDTWQISFFLWLVPGIAPKEDITQLIRLQYGEKSLGKPVSLL